jgi:uncharacterized protein with ATP-grasp and redox domains
MNEMLHEYEGRHSNRRKPLKTAIKKRGTGSTFQQQNKNKEEEDPFKIAKKTFQKKASTLTKTVGQHHHWQFK